MQLPDDPIGKLTGKLTGKLYGIGVGQGWQISDNGMVN